MKTVFLLLLALVAVASSGDVAFKSFCPEIRFNYVFNQYEIAVPVRAGRDLRVNPAAKKSDLEVVHSGDRIRLLCKTYERCWQLKGALASSPKLLPQSLAFFSGELQETSVPRLPRGGLVRSNCNSGWKVFLRRVDGSLSFVQNFKTYERGFGDVSGNFWMGLHNLHAGTGSGTHSSACRLRVRAVGNDNKRYKAEYKNFQVLDRQLGYKLLIAGLVSGNTINSINYPNGMRFSTFDVDRDAYGRSCSKIYGNGGWWYKTCHGFNPTGFYTRRNLDDPTFACMSVRGRNYQTIKSIVMEFKCE